MFKRECESCVKCLRDASTRLQFSCRRQMQKRSVNRLPAKYNFISEPCSLLTSPKEAGFSFDERLFRRRAGQRASISVGPQHQLAIQLAARLAARLMERLLIALGSGGGVVSPAVVGSHRW